MLRAGKGLGLGWHSEGIWSLLALGRELVRLALGMDLVLVSAGKGFGLVSAKRICSWLDLGRVLIFLRARD